MTPWRILEGDALAELKTLPDCSVQTCVTSPPYFGLRDYGTAAWSGGDEACDHLAPMPGGFKSSGLANYANGLNGETIADKVEQRRQQYRERCERCGALRADAQVGLEATPEAYVIRLVEVFAEVRRVLRDDGTLWLNLGDSYANDGKWGGATSGKHVAQLHRREPSHAPQGLGRGKRDTGLKPKDLIGIPWRVAFALQADGWTLRRDIIWHKPNPMPESITDRPTTSHEYVFLFAKDRRYYYDAVAIREPDVGADHARSLLDGQPSLEPSGGLRAPHKGLRTTDGRDGLGRNKRSVWTIATVPFPGAHFATFPTRLVEPCILAGSSEKACGACGAPYQRIVRREGSKSRHVGKSAEKNRAGLATAFSGYEDGSIAPRFVTEGWRPSCAHDSAPRGGVVLDPFAGAGTTGLVANRLGREFVGIELNAQYAAMARDRITNDAPLVHAISSSTPREEQLALMGGDA